MNQNINQNSYANLYLLHSEIFFILKSNKNIKSLKMSHSFPPIYGNQVPFCYGLNKKSSSKIRKLYISESRNLPNRKIIFEIDNIKKDEEITIYFYYIVMILNNDYKTVPTFIPFNKIEKIPINVREWLKPSLSVQSDSILIMLKSYLLKGFTKNEIEFVDRVLIYTSFHRFFLQIIRYLLETNSVLRGIFLPKKYYTGLNDAISYSLIGGLCAAQTNYIAALLRSKGIPTRILIATEFGRFRFANEKTWLDSQHYMIEFYLPDYGWIISTAGKIKYQHKNFIITRILYQVDENIAGNGLSYYGGSAPWFWFSDDNVSLIFPDKLISFYKKPKSKVSGVPAIRLWTENSIIIKRKIAEYIMELTKNMHEAQIKCEIVNKNKIILRELQDAMYYQKSAIEKFKNSDIKNFIKLLKKTEKKLNEIIQYKNDKEIN